MILFDTDTVTHLSYGNANVRRKIDEAEDQHFAVTVITRIEILRGRADSLIKAANEAELRKAAERFRQSEELLSAFLQADLNEDAITHFGRLKKAEEPEENGPGRHAHRMRRTCS